MRMPPPCLHTVFGKSCNATVSNAVVRDLFKSHLDLMAAYERAQVYAVMEQVAQSHPHISVVRCSCGQPVEVERTSYAGVPRFLSCTSCDSLFCTGCSAILQEADQPVNVGDVGDVGHERHAGTDCERPYHAAYNNTNYGPVDQPFDQLQPHQRQAVYDSVAHTLRQNLFGAPCPKCSRPGTLKDDGCTHMKCETVGDSKGCGTSWCYICGGRFAPTGQEYNEWMENPHLRPQVARMHRKDEKKKEDASCPNIFPLATDAFLLSQWHNVDWGFLFDLDCPTPSGRCPMYIHDLRTIGVTVLSRILHPNYEWLCATDTLDREDLWLYHRTLWALWCLKSNVLTQEKISMALLHPNETIHALLENSVFGKAIQRWAQAGVPKPASAENGHVAESRKANVGYVFVPDELKGEMATIDEVFAMRLRMYWERLEQERWPSTKAQAQAQTQEVICLL